MQFLAAIKQSYDQKTIGIQNVIQFGFAAIASILIIASQLFNQTFELPKSDALAYLSIALDVHNTGIFTDGTYKTVAEKIGPYGEGMFFSPLYPFLLSIIMGLDNDFYQMSQCLINNISVPQSCEIHINGLVIAQGLVAAVSLMLIWLSALVITGRKDIAWLAMILASLAECYSYYSSLVLNENLVFPLFSLFSLLLVLGLKKRNWQIMLLAGFSLGLAALARPSYPYVAYGCCLVIVISIAFMALRRNFKGYKIPALLAILIAGYAVTISPWIIRNGQAFGEYTISEGYAPFILVQRVAYNEMTNKELAVSFVYGLPDFGDVLAKKYFLEEDYKRFRYDEPSGFFMQGNGEFKAAAIHEAGGKDKLLDHLLKNEIIDNIGKHIVVTFSLVWSGMWVSKYWGLIAIPLFFVGLVGTTYRKNYSLLVYSLPAWFMLGFNAFTSVNVVRYNLILVPCLAIGVAIVLLFLYDKAMKKITAGK